MCNFQQTLGAQDQIRDHAMMKIELKVHVPFFSLKGKYYFENTATCDFFGPTDAVSPALGIKT